MSWSRVAAVEVLGGGYLLRREKGFRDGWDVSMRQSGIKDDFSV